jgi:RNA recognition motif-containing protein
MNRSEFLPFEVRKSNHGVKIPIRMSFTVFLGNLPTWVTADDIKQWLSAEDLVADAIKVIRNHETQESKGFAFVEAPTNDEMQAIIRRFDRAPLEDRLLRANPAQPPKGKDAPRATGPVAATAINGPRTTDQRPDRRRRTGRNREQAPRSAFANELAKAL